jgi:hypothetical protein
LQIAEHGLDGAQHQPHGAGLRLGPEVDVDDDGALRFQRGNEVLLEKGGLADAAEAGNEQSGAQALVEHARAQELPGHLSSESGRR